MKQLLRHLDRLFQGKKPIKGLLCKKWYDEECKNLCKELKGGLDEERRRKKEKYNAMTRKKKRQYITTKEQNDIH